MCTGVVVRSCQTMLETAEQLRVSGHHRVADAESFAKLRQSPVPEGEPVNPDTGIRRTAIIRPGDRWRSGRGRQGWAVVGGPTTLAPGVVSTPAGVLGRTTANCCSAWWIWLFEVSRTARSAARTVARHAPSATGRRSASVIEGLPLRRSLDGSDALDRYGARAGRERYAQRNRLLRWVHHDLAGRSRNVAARSGGRAHPENELGALASTKPDQ
jgi:hypothetical protein